MVGEMNGSCLSDERVELHFQHQLCVAGTNVYVIFGPLTLK